MTKRTNKAQRAEVRRLAILAEAEAMNIPAFMTPTWRKAYAKSV